MVCYDLHIEVNKMLYINMEVQRILIEVKVSGIRFSIQAHNSMLEKDISESNSCGNAANVKLFAFQMIFAI